MKKALTGQIVGNNDMEYHFVKRNLHQLVIPHLQTLFRHFKDLELERTMDLPLLNKLLSKGATILQDDINKQIEHRYQGLPFELKDQVLSTMHLKMSPLQECINKINDGIRAIKHSPLTNDYIFSVDDFLIEGNSIVLDEDRFKLRFEVSIHSEDQAELFNEFLCFEKQFNRLKACLEKNGQAVYHVEVLMGFFKVDEKINLKFDNTTIKHFSPQAA